MLYEVITVDHLTKEKTFNEKTIESARAEEEKNRKYTNGSVCGFTSPRWTLEYCIAMSSLSKDFHKAVHYGKKILNAREYILLTDEKITEANQAAEKETNQCVITSYSIHYTKLYESVAISEFIKGD